MESAPDGGEPIRHVEPKGCRSADETHDTRPFDSRRPFKGDERNPTFSDGLPQHGCHRLARLVHRRHLL